MASLRATRACSRATPACQSAAANPIASASVVAATAPTASLFRITNLPKR